MTYHRETPTASTPTQQRHTEPIYAATVEKTIPKIPTPKVRNKIITREITPVRIDTTERIKKYLESKTMAWIPNQRMHLRQTTRTSERAQLIYDKETDTYLNYRQLLKHPKYKETWSKSAANEFGRLTQGLKDGRVKGTNTMKFIKKRTSTN